jgi:hypothetical protein
MSQILQAVPAAASPGPKSPHPADKPVNIQPLKDKCYNRKPDGSLEQVKCPDVIVAKPSPSAGAAAGPQVLSFSATPTSRQLREAKTRGKVIPARRLPPVNGVLPVDQGTTNRYGEDPPNSGNFRRVTCPDIIVIEP